MPNGAINILNDCFCLMEDPFDPKIDPRKNFSFADKKAFLTQALDIFKFEELEYYFVKTGMFKNAVEKVEGFLGDSNYAVAANNPPTFLIEAPRGAGRSSLANQIAYQVKQYINGDCALETVPVVGEDEAKLVFAIKKLLEAHIQRNKIPACEMVFTIYPDTLVLSPNGPDLVFLSTIFQQLRNCMLSATPLILIIEEITYERMGWMSNLYTMLAPLNVVLIFLASDYRVRKQYEKLITNGDLTGCWVGLNKLDQQSAINFLIERLDWFRKDKCDPTKLKVFPFDPKVFAQAFKDEKKGVKLLLIIFRRAFNLKVKELNTMENAGQKPEELTLEELLITWEYFDSGYREEVRAKATKKV
jgi:hypothetical protein